MKLIGILNEFFKKNVKYLLLHLFLAILIAASVATYNQLNDLTKIMLIYWQFSYLRLTNSIRVKCAKEKNVSILWTMSQVNQIAYKISRFQVFSCVWNILHTRNEVYGLWCLQNGNGFHVFRAKTFSHIAFRVLFRFFSQHYKYIQQEKC